MCFGVAVWWRRRRAFVVLCVVCCFALAFVPCTKSREVIIVEVNFLFAAWVLLSQRISSVPCVVCELSLSVLGFLEPKVVPQVWSLPKPHKRPLIAAGC